MEKYKKGDCVVIYWDDAVIYGKSNMPYLKKLGTAKTITEGELIEEKDEFVILASPRAIVHKFLHKKYIPKLSASGEKITFFYIPVGMITKIEKAGR